MLCFQGQTIDASLIHDAGFVENIAFAKLILKRPAYLGRDNQPDLSENKPSFYSFTSFFLSFSISLLYFFFFSCSPSFRLPFIHLSPSLLSLFVAADMRVLDSGVC